MRTLITNCPNCAAPLKDGKCPYCGTHVRLANELDFNTDNPIMEFMLRVIRGNELILYPLRGSISNVSVSYPTSRYFSYDISRPFVIHEPPEVEFTFNGIVDNNNSILERMQR